MKKEIEKLIYLAGILDIKGFTKESAELDNIISKMAASKLLRTLTLKMMDLSSDSNLKIALNAFLYQAGVKPGGLNRHDVIDKLNDSFEFHEVQVGLGKYYLTGIEIDSDAALVFDPSSQEWKSSKDLSKAMMYLLADIYKDLNKHISFSSIDALQQAAKQTAPTQTQSPASQPSSNAMTFNFGQGLVPARQHPNGGGWVADIANVSSSAYVGINAQVYDYARVKNRAGIFDNARVYGNAMVMDNAAVVGDVIVEGNSLVGGSARVAGKSSIYGNAIVRGNTTVVDTSVHDDAVVEGNASLHACDVSGNANVNVGRHRMKFFI